MQIVKHTYTRVTLLANTAISKLHSAAALFSRLYVAQVFFSSGLTKIQDWDTTLFLFEEEYQVPLLPYQAAAWLGTFGELVFPILLALGLFSRTAALALFFVNFVAVISLTDIPQAAFNLHIIWGLLLAQVFIYGGGLVAVDRVLTVWRKQPAAQPLNTRLS